MTLALPIPGLLRRSPGLPESIDAESERAGAVPTAKREAIWRAVQGFAASGLPGSLTMCVKKHGSVVLNRAIGSGPNYGSPVSTIAATPTTPICLFSASKAISGLLVHKLVEAGEVSLDAPVAKYVPQFAANGKSKVSVRLLMDHRAGVPKIPFEEVDPAIFMDWDRIVGAICAAKPSNDEFRTQAYHALTAGYVLGELVQRVSGMPLSKALHDWLAEPLGCQNLHYGLPEAWRDRSLRNVFTGPKVVWPLSWVAKRALGAPFEDCVALSNSQPFLDAVIPAGNIFATAEDATRVYQMLLNGGEYNGKRLFKEATLRNALRTSSLPKFDTMLMIPQRFSGGFMLGQKPLSLFGPNTGKAFGHLGFINILTWADRERDLSVALVTTGKNTSPLAVVHLARITTAIAAL